MIVFEWFTMLAVFLGGVLCGIGLVVWPVLHYAKKLQEKRKAEKKRSASSVYFTDLPQEWKKVQ